MKRASEMTEAERAVALAAIIKSGGKAADEPPLPADDAPQPKMAKDMTEAERQAFLADHKRKFG
ncbi:hypothetical protein SAMN05443247_06430 [Bradyrhizobium erythrophlei]|nr:hypothetical protein SAMN05443247_06430 [Bradyrhizobium erythrophlei]